MWLKYQMTGKHFFSSKQHKFPIENYSKFFFYILSFSIRGRLGAFTPLARNLGVLIGYIVGAIVEYQHRSYIFIFFPIMYIFWLNALPNTPQYYMHREHYSVNEP